MAIGYVGLTDRHTGENQPWQARVVARLHLAFNTPVLSEELDKEYVVYPSWAVLPYEWQDLRHELSNPTQSEHFPTHFDYLSAGYSKTAGAFELLPGAAGNGIVSVDISEEGHWLGWPVLCSEASTVLPAATRKCTSSLPFEVLYLDPHEYPGRATRSYTAAITVEHVESADDSIFWLFGGKKLSQQKRLTEEVSAIGQSYGFQVNPIETAPPAMQQEMSGWFRDPSIEFQWYEVQHEARRAGFHYAVLLYLGLHLCSLPRAKMQFAHLVASVSGKPNVRPLIKHW